MTDQQRDAIRALRCCTFLPGGHDKRFVRAMAAALDASPDKPLTENQGARLMTLLHRYRRQHRSCPCAECTAEQAAQPIRKVTIGGCPCGAVGTLFGRRGDGKPPRCCLCVGLDGRRPPPAATACVPQKPYPWLMEERPEPGRVRRVCLSCGESADVCGRKNGRVTKFPGFAQWYRDHIPCGRDWEPIGAKGDGG